MTNATDVRIATMDECMASRLADRVMPKERFGLRTLSSCRCDEGGEQEHKEVTKHAAASHAACRGRIRSLETLACATADRRKGS